MMREFGLTDNGRGGIFWSVRKGLVRTYSHASAYSIGRLASTITRWRDAGKMRFAHGGPGYSWYAQDIAHKDASL